MAGAVMLCVSGPPSDHELKGSSFFPWSEECHALMVLARADDHRTGERRRGRRRYCEPQPSRSCPEGQDDSPWVQSHGLGIAQASRVGGCQPELKVRRILMIGAINEPLATPANVCTGCEWQFDGQCCWISSHDRAEDGSVPSWASVALPEKLITSPTFQVVPAAGVADDRRGCVFPPRS